MNLYWVYDLPNWLFALLTVLVFVVGAVAGLYPTRRWVRRLHQTDHSHNDIVGFYLAAITVFYGITLGLVAVGTWTTFSNAGDRVNAEAQTVASLYRDVSNYDEPWRSQLRGDLRNYVKYLVEVSWPQQQKGLVPAGSGAYIDEFQQHLRSFKVQTPADQVYQAEVFHQFNILVEQRRGRLASVTTGLPTALWVLIILGAVLSIVVTLFFDARSFRMHLSMTVCFSALLGLLVFLVAVLDNPFRGGVSVSAYPFQQLYESMGAGSPN